MSIFAGIIVRQPGMVIPPSLRQELRAALSRNPDDMARLRESSGERIYAVHLDLEALADSGVVADGASTAWLAGAPLLQAPGAAAPAGRNASLATLAADLARGSDDGLRACRGTFCAAVSEGGQRLHLVTDKFGLRPIYCWIQPDYVIFTTALRIIEALSQRPQALDLQAIAEISCFNFALADRTPYQDVICLRAAEVLSVDEAGLRRRQYWRWDQLPQPADDGLTAPQRVYRSFQDAVRVRLGQDRTAAAFLSGGLDSRAIAAELRAQGADVHTANFAWPGSQDLVLGKMAAEKLGTRHSELPRKPMTEGDPYSKSSVLEWLQSPDFLASAPERPRVIWSGDGGSVGLGHVYLNQAVVDAMRAGDAEGAVGHFIEYNQCALSARLLKPRVGQGMAGMVRQGMLDELRQLAPPDPGRSFHLFLMLNDQRRHLFHHFETLDLSRIEFELPFFDAEFMADVIRAPIDPFLRHVFYLDWLACFPPGVLETPWQAYPRHTPCPLPLPEGLFYQWHSNAAADWRNDARQALEGARKLLGSDRFAQDYLGYFSMRLFMLSMRLGKGQRSYQLKLPTVLHRYWSRIQAG